MAMKKVLLTIALVILLAACVNNPENDAAPDDEVDAVETSSGKDSDITVSLINQDSETIGKAVLTESNEGVKIALEAEGLTPGQHGFHIHEHGVCEPENKFESAGGHFNPFNKEHGTLNPKGPHAGDLPNIIVQADGTVSEEIDTELVTLKKDEPNSLLKRGGTSLVIHADADDYKTNPAGNAGERVACGVIK